MKTFNCVVDPDDAVIVGIVLNDGSPVVYVDAVVDDRIQGVWLTPDSARSLASELERIADKVESP